MKGMILLANGFEDVEAFITIDLLRRAKIMVDTISLTEDLRVKTQSQVTINAEKHFQEIKYQDYDFLIIPGGRAVMETHWFHPFTKTVIEYMNQQHRLIACICAAPSILGKYQVLDGIPFTCYPTFEQYIPNGKYQALDKVVVSKHIITSKAAGTTFEFAHAILTYLKGKTEANRILESVYYIE